MHRRVFLQRLGGAGALLAGMSLLEACSPATPASQPPASSTAPATAGGPRGQMIVAQGGDVVSMDPHKINDMISMSVAAAVYDTLLTRDASGAIAPNLATSWTAVDDQTWRFELRQDVTFHNGEKLTAETVKANWDRLKDPNSKTTSSGLQNVTGARVVDNYTVDIVSSGPNPMVPARMCMFAGTIVPTQYLQSVGADALAAKPVGTGPYRFAEWIKDDHTTLAAASVRRPTCTTPCCGTRVAGEWPRCHFSVWACRWTPRAGAACSTTANPTWAAPGGLPHCLASRSA